MSAQRLPTERPVLCLHYPVGSQHRVATATPTRQSVGRSDEHLAKTSSPPAAPKRASAESVGASCPSTASKQPIRSERIPAATLTPPPRRSSTAAQPRSGYVPCGPSSLTQPEIVRSQTGTQPGVAPLGACAGSHAPSTLMPRVFGSPPQITAVAQPNSRIPSRYPRGRLSAPRLRRACGRSGEVERRRDLLRRRGPNGPWFGAPPEPRL